MEPQKFTTEALRAMVSNDALSDTDRDDAIEELLHRAATLTDRSEGQVKRGFVDRDGY